MVWVYVFAGVFGLAALSLIYRARKAGPRQVSAEVLARGRPVVRITADDPGEGWQETGSKTQADGLNLRFDHDDDPQAEATLLVPEFERASRSNTFSHVLTIDLSKDWETHHLHTSGYVFRVRLRGDSAVAGKQVRLKMVVGSDGRPYGGRIENDDDTDAAVGGWIEVEWAEVLRVERS
jgi:hypothetical protein